MQPNELLLSEQGDDGVLQLTLNDNGRRNALSEALLTQLGNALQAASTDTAVRVIILAAGGSAFCAGHDLKEMTAGRAGDEGGRAYFSKIMSLCSGVMQAIVNSPKPVIAKVSGIATAAGCQLVASCDLAIAADTARFGTPGVHIGLFCSTPMVALSRNVSNKHAMELLLTGDVISAERAESIGLINRVVAAADLDETTRVMAAKIASKSSMALAMGKRAFYAQRELPLADAYAYTSDVMVDNMLTQDAAEGIAAFVEKRTPRWQDA